MMRMIEMARADRRHREGGFTLIELLVVIVILGVLAAVVVFAVRGTGDRGKKSAVDIDERTIRTAQEAFCGQKGRYGLGSELVSGGFLSDRPEYHAITAQQDGGPCNGWSFSIDATVAGGGTAPAEAGPGEWSLTAPPPHATYELVRLSNGKALSLNRDSTDVDVWDPATGAWTPADTAPAAPRDRTSLLITDDPATPASECAGAVNNCGKVLVNSSFAFHLFDPGAPSGSQWQTLPDVATSYANQANAVSEMVQLKVNCGSNCGKVFMTAYDGAGPVPVTADLYDPRDNSFESVPYPEPSCSAVPDDCPSAEIASNGAMATLPDGRILIAGWLGSDFAPHARFFDPITETVSTAPTPPILAVGDGGPVPTVLPNGDIFFGGPAYGEPPDYFSSKAQVYMPEPGGPGTWRMVPSCSTDPENYQMCHVIGPLENGKVLAFTNYSEGVDSDFGSPTGQTFIFDPASETWSRTGDLNSPSSASVSVNLDAAGGPCAPYCGRLLLAGTSTSGTAEMYTP